MVNVVSKEYSVIKTLDCRGLYCPLPIIKMQKAVKGMAEGEIIKVLATDSGSKRDFDSWCRKTGNKLLESTEDDGVFTYIIEKTGGG